MWFKKKEKAPAHEADFSKYKIKITGKVMCAYEALTGKPFLSISTEEDIKHLFYCSLVLNNEEFATMDYTVFEFLITDKSVLDWMTQEYVNIGAYLSQFSGMVGHDEESNNKGEDQVFYMLDAISGLIVRMGIDPHYVMYEMEEWEIAYYYKQMQDVDRDRLTEERLWTYLQVLPHVGKKLGSPEKFVPFPWEKEVKKKKAEEGLKNNEYAVKHTIGMNLDDLINGKRRLNNNTEQGGAGSGQ